MSKKIFDESKHFADEREKAPLVKEDFKQKCDLRLKLLRLKLTEICSLLAKT